MRALRLVAKGVWTPGVITLRVWVGAVIELMLIGHVCQLWWSDQFDRRLLVKDYPVQHALCTRQQFADCGNYFRTMIYCHWVLDYMVGVLFSKH